MKESNTSSNSINEKEPLYANVIIDIAHEAVDKTFQYKIPARLSGQLQIGQEVRVPFGTANRTRRGYIIELTDHAEYAVDKLKELSGAVAGSVSIEGQLVALAGWIRDTYGSTMIQALKTVLPVKDKMQALSERSIRLAVSKETAKAVWAECSRKHYTAKARLLEALLQQPQLSAKTVREQLNVTQKTVQALERDGLVATDTQYHYRNPVEGERNEKELVLTRQQQSVVDAVHAVFRDKDKKPFLLHGVTGSGKTQVYVELVARAAREGRSSIVLIPEIALTKQTVMRFYQKFGSRVSIMHSRLSKGERFDQFERAKKGEIDVIIGPRSALFTPFSNLGYIIIDEEHETSYKSETVPKYHARETAIQRASMTGATVLLASATPSVDSYHKAMCGQYVLLELAQRISKEGLAQVELVDLREELKAGNRSVFSRQLQQMIQDRLAKRQQTLLFLNRRGYHGFLSCRSCGEAVKCPNCDVTLSLHKNGQMICHYCGYEQPKVTKCPACDSPYIGGFRMGTEQLEEYVGKAFPGARVLRMDLDTTRKKHGHEQIVTAFANQEADILIGTQMIVKGHDFPNVTLVGILAADMSLQISDFRSAERTFQLLVQAAGRAGRADLPGQVIIQTYNPQHYSIRLAKKQAYKQFYEEEMKFRQAAMYPPAGSVLEVCVSADSQEAVRREMKHVAELSKDGPWQMVGPAPAPIEKLNNRYRHLLYIKSKEWEILKAYRCMLETQYVPQEGVQVAFDVQ